MFLRNHGVVCCGKSIEEAWLNGYHTVLAADTQIKMMPLGLDNLVLIDEETRRKAYEVGQKGGGGVNTAKKEGEKFEVLRDEPSAQEILETLARLVSPEDLEDLYIR